MRYFYPSVFVITVIFILIHLWSPDRYNILRETAKIGIIVVMKAENVNNYERSLDSLKCYSQIHGYTLIFVYEHIFAETCRQRSAFARKYCIVSNFLENYDHLLVLDPDMGVVNPKRRIEEFIDNRFDVSVYENLHNQEIAADSILLKNTKFSMDFVKGLTDYVESNATHENESSAVNFHLYLLQTLFAIKYEKCLICEELRNSSKNLVKAEMLENAVQMMLRSVDEFGKIRIHRKSSVWARDAAITNSLWDSESDFVLSGWRMDRLKAYSQRHLPISPYRRDNTTWYDPIVGDYDFDLCVEWNTTWSYDPNLIVPKERVEAFLTSLRNLVQLDGFKRLSKISSYL